MIDHQSHKVYPSLIPRPHLEIKTESGGIQSVTQSRLLSVYTHGC